MCPQTSNLDRDAELIYNYHRMSMPLRPASAIFCLCSLDTRVATRAAQLLLDGYGEYLIYSGGSGKLTEGRFSEPEAEVFANIARNMGVPDDKIIVEPESTNTGENVRFTHALLKRRGLKAESFVLVQKPYMERRTYATFKKQWPDAETDFTVTSPELDFEQYPNEENPKTLVVNIMVGDLVRIRDYPAKGFQIEQEIPEEIWEANKRLIAAGYNGHLP
ncbi:uncharacterized protein CTRU02_204809 [Colletotrichum truncatum]|uniref:Uncharacterized protein n=1 Tax=Colletotrichum truncatum TaxID=5467 RepID=A0ACC3ZD69_COLTU|nr:uncharacterized protein CTRU02_03043 [Colletotrichum truncatum]KAF6798001.1 hypothetical protein CTRU02_03043 [Colletotrichum truncatum]